MFIIFIMKMNMMIYGIYGYHEYGIWISFINHPQMVYMDENNALWH